MIFWFKIVLPCNAWIVHAKSICKIKLDHEIVLL